MARSDSRPISFWTSWSSFSRFARASLSPVTVTWVGILWPGQRRRRRARESFPVAISRPGGVAPRLEGVAGGHKELPPLAVAVRIGVVWPVDLDDPEPVLAIAMEGLADVVDRLVEHDRAGARTGDQADGESAGFLDPWIAAH